MHKSRFQSNAYFEAITSHLDTVFAYFTVYVSICTQCVFYRIILLYKQLYILLAFAYFEK